MTNQIQADIDRATILERYYTRIERNERTKLTQTEQAQLVRAFIDDIRQLDTPSAIRHRCAAEIAMLEAGYPIATIASRLLAPYRRAIREAIEAGDLPLNDHTSHIVRFTKHATGEEEETQEHWALTQMKYDPATYAQLRGQTIEQNNARQDDLQPVKVDSYLATVTELLTEEEPHALTAAIAAATGRRHTEVAVRGTFAPTDHPYILRFTGQQKKRDGQVDASTPFDIVTLVPSKIVLDAVARLRQHPGVQRLKRETSVQASAIRAFNTQVNRVVKKAFEEPGIVPRIQGARSVSVHRLRGVYAALAVYLWCPPDQHEHRFVQHYLGHVLKESNLPNSLATSHYFHYRLLDGDGQPLHAKGVLRDSHGAPPEAPNPPAPTKSSRRQTLAAADLDRLQVVTDQLEIDGTLAERFHALLNWVEQAQVTTTAPTAAPQKQSAVQIDTTPTEMPLRSAEQPQERPNDSIAQSPTPPAAEMMPIVSDQAKTLAWLTEEITTLRQQLAATQQAEAELRTLRSERSILQAKIDSLVGENKTLQRRLERFESLGRALWGSSDSVPPLPQDPPATPGTTESTHAATPSNGRPAATQQPTARAADGSSSRGVERANRIWHAIRTWNDTPGRHHDEKIALSASVLEKRFGLFRPTAKAFLEAHQQEIEAHNQTHRITAPTHNRSVPDEIWTTIKDQTR